MENFDKKSLKVLVTVVVCCLLFVVFLPYAYNTVPKKNETNYTENAAVSSAETVNKNKTEDNADLASNKLDDEIEENVQKADSESEISELVRSKNEVQNRPQEPEELQEITETEPNDSDVFVRAKKLRDSDRYESAVYEYEQALKATENNDFKAQCYQEIAITYATMKRYGTALSYAQKAYNTSPSTDREVLLARLYYKTGNDEKANERINMVLKRDFDE